MVTLTLLGGGLGASLLLLTPSSSFVTLVPSLLLIGSLAFAFGNQTGRWLRRRMRIGTRLVLSGQFLLGVYGGYFGGAVGIMMMAVWALFGVSDIQVINANKTLYVGLANAIAVASFTFAGKVFWSETLVLMAASVVGGLLSANYVKKIDPRKLRMAIVIVNFLVTAGFFIKTFA